MILLLILVPVITLTFAIAVCAMVLDWWDNAREVVHQTELEAGERLERERLPRETQILADIEWDTEYFPVTEPEYRTEGSS